MKKSLIVAASALAMAATPAFAVTASGNSSTINLSATVQKACGVGNHMSGSSSKPGYDQSDITVDLTKDGNGQFKTPSDFTRSFGNVWCNAPATVQVHADPLMETTNQLVGDVDSFTNRFDLQVSGGAMNAYVGGQTVDTSVAGGETKSFPMPTAFETGLGQYDTVDIRVLPSLRSGEPRRPIAGDYTGKVTITATIS